MLRLVLLLIFPIVADAQVSIREIKLKLDSDFQKDKNAPVIFPVISTGNGIVDDKMNLAMLRAVSFDDTATDITKTLLERMADNLSELDYTVTLKTMHVLSITMRGMGCGAYCSSWRMYFNFNLFTGENMKIGEVIKGGEIDSFTKLVYKDKLKALHDYDKEMNGYLLDKKMDVESVKIAKGYIEEHCIDSARINLFSLSTDGLEIIDECEFPHFMQGLQPVYELKYSYKIFEKIFVPGFLQKLKTSSIK